MTERVRSGVDTARVRPVGRSAHDQAFENTSLLVGGLLAVGLVEGAEDWVGQRGVEVEGGRSLHVLPDSYFRAA